ITPGQIDVLLFGFTQEAARIVEPGWLMNPAGNWWFTLTIVVPSTPAIWWITDKAIEPRLGTWSGEGDEETRAELGRTALEPGERRGLRRAGLAALAIVAAYFALTMIPGYAPLLNPEGEGTGRYQPLFAALIAGFFL